MLSAGNSGFSSATNCKLSIWTQKVEAHTSREGESGVAMGCLGMSGSANFSEGSGLLRAPMRGDVWRELLSSRPATSGMYTCQSNLVMKCWACWQRHLVVWPSCQGSHMPTLWWRLNHIFPLALLQKCC